MKKIIAIMVVLVLMSTLCACGNMSMGMGNFEFKRVHIDTHNYSGCFSIEKWYDNGTGLEVETREAGTRH